MKKALIRLVRIISYPAFILGVFWLIMYFILGSNRIWIDLWQIVCLVVLPFLIILFLHPSENGDIRKSQIFRSAKAIAWTTLGVVIFIGLGLLGGYFIWESMNSFN